jgi:hypothetical protein
MFSPKLFTVNINYPITSISMEAPPAPLKYEHPTREKVEVRMSLPRKSTKSKSMNDGYFY